jgi:hypothetical protein
MRGEMLKADCKCFALLEYTAILLSQSTLDSQLRFQHIYNHVGHARALAALAQRVVAVGRSWRGGRNLKFTGLTQNWVNSKALIEI